MFFKNQFNKNIFLLLILFLSSNTKAAEKVYLYKGTLSRSISVNSLSNFQNTKKPNKKIKNLIKITNQNKNELLKTLSYEIEIPLNISSKLMNSKIGEVLLERISKIIHPHKIKNKDIGIKAIRSALIISSYKNNEKINLIDFFKAYPNKNVSINLNALNEILTKVESLNELIEFYTNSPLKKLKDGSSST